MKLYETTLLELRLMTCYRGWEAFKLVPRVLSQPSDKDLKVSFLKELCNCVVVSVGKRNQIS